MKLKHKKLGVKPVPAVNPWPLRLRVPSDGNELAYLRHDVDSVTYIYDVSITKKGREITLTKDQFERFMRFATNVAKINL